MKHLKRVVDAARDCRKWRVEHGYRQKDVAMDTGYTPQYISRFERGLANNMLIYRWYIERGYRPNGET